MFTRLKKIEKEIKKIDNPRFLKTIGIKKIYIKNFLKAFEERIKNENDKLRIFRLYLTYIHENYIIEENKSIYIDDEIEAFRCYGFTKKASTHYVKCIDGIYNKDSTINWIYRLVENLIQRNSHKSFSKFLEFCYTKSNSNESDSEIEFMEEEEEYEDENENEDEDEDDYIIDLVSCEGEGHDAD